MRKSYLGYAREIPSSDGAKYEFENTFLSQVSKGLLDLALGEYLFLGTKKEYFSIQV